MPGLVADEFVGSDAILARVIAETGLGLLLTVVETIDLGPLGPGIVQRTGFRRHRQDFELHKTTAAMAHGRTNTVGAGVAAANDNNILAPGRDPASVLMAAVE